MREILYQVGSIEVTYHPIVGETTDIYDWDGDTENLVYSSVVIFGVLVRHTRSAPLPTENIKKIS